MYELAEQLRIQNITGWLRRVAVRIFSYKLVRLSTKEFRELPDLFLSAICCLSLSDTQCSLADYKRLSQAVSLRELDVSKSSFSFRESDFDDLSVVPHPHLEYLNVSGCKNIKDWSSMSAFTKLKGLDVSDTSFTKFSLLADLPLQSLDLASTPAVDWGEISLLTSVQILSLANTSFRDISLLRDLFLRQLDLRNCKNLINEDALSLLKHLERIYLFNSNITSLEPLLGLSNLQYINLTGAPVSLSEIQSFCEKRPDVSVFCDYQECYV